MLHWLPFLLLRLTLRLRLCFSLRLRLRFGFGLGLSLLSGKVLSLSLGHELQQIVHVSDDTIAPRRIALTNLQRDFLDLFGQLRGDLRDTMGGMLMLLVTMRAVYDLPIMRVRELYLGRRRRVLVVTVVVVLIAMLNVLLCAWLRFIAASGFAVLVVRLVAHVCFGMFTLRTVMRKLSVGMLAMMPL